MKIFGQQLKILRKKNNLIQADLANFLDCSIRHYQRIEKGDIDIPSSTLIKLADYFDVSLDYLVGITNDFNIQNKENNIPSPTIKDNCTSSLVIDNTDSSNINVSKEFEYAYSQLSDDSKKELQNYLNTLYLNEQYEKNKLEPTDPTSTKKTKNTELDNYTEEKQA